MDEKILKFNKRRKLKDKAFKLIGQISVVCSIGFLVFLLGSLLYAGLPYITLNFLFFDRFTTAPSQVANGTIGIFTPLIGSVLIMLVVLICAVPLGIIAGLYMEEYMDKKRRIYTITSILVSNLAGVPAVIYGLLGATLFMILNLRGSFIAAGITLSILSLPVIIITTQEALKTVPNSLKEAAYGLGFTKWQVIKGVSLPYAMSTISTGVIFALSRAIGEAAPLIMVGVVVDSSSLPHSLDDKITALPLVIDYFYSAPTNGFGLAAAAAIVLLVVLLSMNAVAIYIRERGNKNK